MTMGLLAMSKESAPFLEYGILPLLTIRSMMPQVCIAPVRALNMLINDLDVYKSKMLTATTRMDNSTIHVGLGIFEGVIQKSPINN